MLLYEHGEGRAGDVNAPEQHMGIPYHMAKHWYGLTEVGQVEAVGKLIAEVNFTSLLLPIALSIVGIVIALPSSNFKVTINSN